MNLTKEEMETIINFNEAEKTASVYTYNKALIRKIEKIRSENPCVQVIRKGENWCEYLIPKKMIKVNAPRTLSEENRQRMAENLKKARERNE